jgi:hypothetical protein
MALYKLRHNPTGLYYQPHKHRGNNLSKNGKVYQTKSHGLSSTIRRGGKTFPVMVVKNGPVHKQSKDILNYSESRWTYNQMVAETLVSDWELVEVTVSQE